MRNLAGTLKKSTYFSSRTGWARKMFRFIKMSSEKKRCEFWLVSGWFVLVFGWFEGGLWVVWVVCRWFLGGSAGLWADWMVCGWFGWFMGDFEFTANASTWVLSCEFAAWSQNTPLWEHLWRAASRSCSVKKVFLKFWQISVSESHFKQSCRPHSTLLKKWLR